MILIVDCCECVHTKTLKDYLSEHSEWYSCLGVVRTPGKFNDTHLAAFQLSVSCVRLPFPTPIVSLFSPSTGETADLLFLPVTEFAESRIFSRNVVASQAKPKFVKAYFTSLNETNVVASQLVFSSSLVAVQSENSRAGTFNSKPHIDVYPLPEKIRCLYMAALPCDWRSDCALIDRWLSERKHDLKAAANDSVFAENSHADDCFNLLPLGTESALSDPLNTFLQECA